MQRQQRHLQRSEVLRGLSGKIDQSNVKLPRTWPGDAPAVARAAAGRTVPEDAFFRMIGQRLRQRRQTGKISPSLPGILLARESRIPTA